MKNLIKNVTVLTMDENNTVIEKGAVLFEDDKILQVGANIPESFADMVIDGKNGILMPGMINWPQPYFYDTIQKYGRRLPGQTAPFSVSPGK
mgnify:CR=1 FL=1